MKQYIWGMICVLGAIVVWQGVFAQIGPWVDPPNILPYENNLDLSYARACRDYNGELRLQRSNPSMQAPSPQCSIVGECTTSYTFCLRTNVRNLPWPYSLVICSWREVEEANRGNATYKCEPTDASPRDSDGRLLPFTGGSESSTLPWPRDNGCYLTGTIYREYCSVPACAPNVGESCDDGDPNTERDSIQCNGLCRGTATNVLPPPPPPPAPHPESPTASFTLRAGVNPPYTRSLSGIDSLTNVDGDFDVTITGWCGDISSDDNEKCRVDYKLDCTSDGTWERNQPFVNVSNGDKDRTFYNACAYTSPGSYTMRGEVTVTRNANGLSNTYTSTVPVTIGTSHTLSAVVNPPEQTVTVGGEARFSSSVSGGVPPYTCLWSAPGSSSRTHVNSCSTFGVIYGSSGTYNLSFSVRDNMNNTAQDTAQTRVESRGGSPSTGRLTVLRNGQGTVRSDVVPGIICGNTCEYTFDLDETVVLTATPAPGWRLVGWEGSCAGTPTTSSTCSLTISGNQTVTVRFRPQYVIREF